MLGMLNKSRDITSPESCTNPSNSFLETCDIMTSMSSSNVKVDVFVDFERHTLGFGSKLVFQMGHIGVGLRKRG